MQVFVGEVQKGLNERKNTHTYIHTDTHMNTHTPYVISATPKEANSITQYLQYKARTHIRLIQISAAICNQLILHNHSFKQKM